MLACPLPLWLQVGHAGGELRVQHSGRSLVYSWGEGAAAGEVQWAAFPPSCLHEVLPVQAGARVTLAYELHAQRGEPGGGQHCALFALGMAAFSCPPAHRWHERLLCLLDLPLPFPAYCSPFAAGSTKQAQPSALPGSTTRLLRALRSALDCPGFMVNGGRLGFACQVGWAGVRG